MSHHVLSVGQCGFDHATLSQYLQSQFDASVVPAATAAEASSLIAKQAARGLGFDLVLVNRVFDQDGDDGVEFIRYLLEMHDVPTPPMMLVSNYPDAQQAAVTAGALPGFGKAELPQPETRARLSAVLADDA